jgi:hypothetical protein
MCQICTIKILSSSAHWHKPLEPSISDLHFLITCVHDQHAAWEKQQKTLTAATNTTNTLNPNTTALTTSNNSTTTTNTNIQTAPLLSLLRTLSTSLTSLEHERTAWWKSKTPLIKALKDEVSGQSEQKLTALQKTNNSAISMLEGMEAKLGGFVRWTMGIKGGVEELCKGGDGEQ